MRTILILCLSILFLPLTLAAEGLTVTGGEEGTDYSYAENVYTVLTGTALTFSGTTAADRIVIAEGKTADITLSDLSIDVSAIASAAAIRLEKKAKLTLHITETESTLKSGNNAAGIGLSDESDLHITAESETPKLTVLGGINSSYGGFSGAGIGSNLSEEGKASIRISNGTISATGGTNDPKIASDGIGQSGDRKLQMVIVFDGGKITAKGGKAPWNGTAGYGINGDVTVNSGIFTNCTLNGNIVINDGTFTNCPISGTKAIINKGTINNTDGSRISSKEIIINGGDISINVPIGKEGNAIGSQNGKVTINGGTIIANTNTVSDGFGNNFYSSITGEVTITGGNVTAISNSNAAGIGGYGGRSLSNVDGNNITISGGIVYAESKGYGAGIGGATNHEGNNPGAGKNIKITGGTVTAISKNGTGIGGGGTNGNTENIIISGGTIFLSASRLIGIIPKDENNNDVYLAVIPEIANATDASVDNIPYYISGNHPQKEEKTADNKLYLYMTSTDHTITVRKNNNSVTTYTATYVSTGVDSDGNNKGYFSFGTGSTTTPTDNSAITFEAKDITTTYNKESNELKVTLTVTEKVTTRSTTMNSVQLALSEGTKIYFSDRQTVTGSGDYKFTFDTKGLGAGEYTLTANYGGSATSLAANQQTTTLTIEKAEASNYTEPSALTATYGQKLADITLPDSWVWDAPETSVGNAGLSPNTFAATITP